MVIASENPGIALLCQIPEKQPQEDIVVPVVSVSAHLQRISSIAEYFFVTELWDVLQGVRIQTKVVRNRSC